MRTDYLHVQASGKIDNTGQLTLTLTPPVGQYWAPKIARVSLNYNSFAPGVPAYCAIYHGPPQQPPAGFVGPFTSPLNASTFIDETFAGYADATGLLSGLVVVPGEAITARWQACATGATAVLDVYGITSDVPPALGFSVPWIMGPGFQGKGKIPAPWEAPRYTAQINFNNPGPGAEIVIITPILQDPNSLPEYLFMHTLQWAWSTGNSAAHGQWQAGSGNGTLAGWTRSVLAPDNAGDAGSRFQDFKGVFVGIGGGLSWLQGGTLAANTVSCAGSVTFSTMTVYSLT